MNATVGYYVHHHGAGHAARFSRIAAAFDGTLLPISELDLPGGIRLSSDVVPKGVDPTAGGGLHWAPVGDPGSARRSAVFGRWLADASPRGVVVDVSVEATLLCRLFGVRTVVVRQHGDRTDAAHELAYRAASRLLAPFPDVLEHPCTPGWVQDKTTYTGFIADRATRQPAASTRADDDTPRSCDIVILWGAGGGSLSRSDVNGIVRGAGSGRVWFAGSEPFDLDELGVRTLGWVDDVADVLQHGPTVVASAGNNVVADAAIHGCPLVVVPQDRPFDEQVRHAQVLAAAQVAAMVGPRDPKHGDPETWSGALAAARDRRSALADLATTGGGAHAAAHTIDRAFDTR